MLFAQYLALNLIEKNKIKSSNLWESSNMYIFSKSTTQNVYYDTYLFHVGTKS